MFSFAIYVCGGKRANIAARTGKTKGERLVDLGSSDSHIEFYNLLRWTVGYQ